MKTGALHKNLSQVVSSYESVLSLDSSSVFASSSGGAIRVRRADTGTIIYDLRCESSCDPVVKLSDELIGAGVRGGKIQIWNFVTGTFKYSLQAKHPTGYITRITSLNNSLMATGTGAYNDAFELVTPVVRVWNLSEAIYDPTTTPSSNAFTHGLNEQLFTFILCLKLWSIL